MNTFMIIEIIEFLAWWGGAFLVGMMHGKYPSTRWPTVIILLSLLVVFLSFVASRDWSGFTFGPSYAIYALVGFIRGMVCGPLYFMGLHKGRDGDA